ncbi:Hypothetical predicted protein, partial [Mytilus galloprovincialis]
TDDYLKSAIHFIWCFPHEDFLMKKNNRSRKNIKCMMTLTLQLRPRTRAYKGSNHSNSEQIKKIYLDCFLYLFSTKIHGVIGPLVFPFEWFST